MSRRVSHAWLGTPVPAKDIQVYFFIQSELGRIDHRLLIILAGTSTDSTSYAGRQPVPIPRIPGTAYQDIRKAISMLNECGSGAVPQRQGC